MDKASNFPVIIILLEEKLNLFRISLTKQTLICAAILYSICWVALHFFSKVVV